MKFSPKKLVAAFLSAVILSTTAVAFPISAEAAAAKYEFETGTLSGASVEKNYLGYSGSGYVYLKNKGQYMQVTVNVSEAGAYDLNICYLLPSDSGSKTQNLYVNGVMQGSISFNTSNSFKTVKVGQYQLKAGSNTIKIEANWGWQMFDYLTIEKTVLPELVGNNTLVDELHTDSAQGLMNYLCDTYGNNIISGQQELYGNADETEFDYIYNLTGKYPAIRGFDYMNWSQAQNLDDGTNDRIIDWVNNKGGIATLCWHWFVPNNMSTYTPENLQDNCAFYSKTTNFSPKKAITAGTAENTFINTDIAKIAKALKELQDNDIPVIFRPFHEAEGSSSTNGSGSWFWWGTDGAETYKELWKYLYNKLTNEYDIHNLIWEWNSYDYATSTAWYPGDDYVDIVAYDKYNANGSTPNESAISGTFYNLVNQYDGKKMVAMAENDTIPSVDNLINEKAGWLYFCPWYEKYITSTSYNSASTLKSIYQSDYVITRDELPDYKTYNVSSTGTDISSMTATLSQTSYTYDGKAKTPTVTVNGLTSSDYTVEYSNNINAGTATVTIIGTGDYKGHIKKTFTISKKAIAAADVTLSTSTYTYSGSTIKPAVTVKSGTTKLINGTDYSLSYSSNTNAGTGYVIVTTKGNYSGSVRKSFIINTKSISTAAVSGISEKAYNGKSQTQNVTVKIGTKTLVKDVDYTVSYKDNKAIGKATLRIRGKGNYSGVITKYFNINPPQQAIKGIAAKAAGFKVRWTTNSSATGYVIQYSTSSSFSSKKNVWIRLKTSEVKTVTGLSSKKTYYVRVMTYTTVNGVKYYSAPSAVRKITTK